MQRIASLFVFGARPLAEDLGSLSPWLDLRVVPLHDVLALIEERELQRFVTSHLPLDPELRARPGNRSLAP